MQLSRAWCPEVPAAGAPVIAVVGPTAVGKTDLADRIAGRLDGEIVSADSMQVYRGMDIGTAKPSPDERSAPYHCMDLVDPDEPFSAALYQRFARAAIADVVSRDRMPVVVGGSGLYVRAALDDWRFPSGETTSQDRRRLEKLADELGPAGLHRLLAERDPEAARIIHPNNVRRVVRALEMIDQGVPYSEQARRFSERRSVYDARFIGLTMERQRLYERIDERVERMIREGLLDEVRRLLDDGYREALTARAAIGYKELVPVLEGDRELDEAVDEIKRSTRRYAKRQMTWFRADPRVRWLDATDRSSEGLFADALSFVGADHTWRAERG